jgi:hypothetical protein
MRPGWPGLVHPFHFLYLGSVYSVSAEMEEEIAQISIGIRGKGLTLL